MAGEFLQWLSDANSPAIKFRDCKSAAQNEDDHKNVLQLVGSNPSAMSRLKQFLRDELWLQEFPSRYHYSLDAFVIACGGDWVLGKLYPKSDWPSSDVQQRANLVGFLTRCLAKRIGREWTRQHARTKFFEMQYEEERDALVEVLLEEDVHTPQEISDWDERAAGCVERVTRRARREGKDTWTGHQYALRQRVGHSTSPGWLRDRTTQLRERLTLPLDLKDSRFSTAECDNIARSAGPQPIRLDSRLRGNLRFFLRRLGDLDLVEFTEGAFLPPPVSNQNSAYSVSLLRVLHMQSLMQAPSLTDAISRREHPLMPYVLHYLLGDDAVQFSPVLRVGSNVEKRWRARWNETMGEALAVLLLEDAIGLELTTLSRIPESNVPTPDFRALTKENQTIVFEAKGTSDWQTHKKQRTRALEQLGKKKPKKAGKSAASPGYSVNARAFAMSLFAACEGEEKSSLFHVHDPPFLFAELFGGEQDLVARRSHFAAVLEAARFPQFAVAVRRGATFDASDLKEFSISQDDDRKIVGTYLPVGEWAEALQHPELDSLGSVKIFVGVDQTVFELLAGGKLPTRSCDLDKNSNINPETPTPGVRSGTLPSREYSGESRGVYSQLSNGSFLAIEIGQ